MSKIFHFKSKLLDFHIKIFFIEIKLHLNGFFSLIFSLFKPRNYISLFKLYKNNNAGNILIIELNDFHSEIFPSWLFYFKKLSYENKIFFLAPSSIHKLKPFDLIAQKENDGYSFYEMDRGMVMLWFNFGLFSKYRKVIFNTDVFYFSHIDRYSQLLDIFKRRNVLKNTIFLSHGILQSISCKNNFISRQDQLMTISPSISQDANIRYILPLFNEDLFNQDQEKAEIFNQKKKFVSCGNIKIHSKDSDGLVVALEKTKEYDKIVSIVGKAPRSLIKNKSVCYCGKKLSFLELKSILRSSHFILFLLQNNVSYQYKFNSSSGSLSLALNFNLVPIIEESFARFYCLDETSAVLYKEGQLDMAVRRACNMKYDEYLKIQSSLRSVKLSLRDGSLNNLEMLTKEERYQAN